MKFLMFIGPALHAIFLGVITAAIFQLHTQPPAKILLIALIALWLLSLNQIGNMFEAHQNTQMKLLQFLRTLYISTEMQRLEPENKVPSGDLLLKDLKIERECRETDRKMRKELGSPITTAGFKLLMVAFYLSIVAFTVVALSANWDIIEQLLA